MKCPQCSYEISEAQIIAPYQVQIQKLKEDKKAWKFIALFFIIGFALTMTLQILLNVMVLGY